MSSFDVTELNVKEDSCNLTVQQLRQSFDRFEDNLVENILSFLTFNQKVLFESVSKQWKKCVYSHQRKLHIMEWPRWDLDHQNIVGEILEPLEVFDYNSGTAAADGLQAINTSFLKTILKKCNSIEEVIFGCFVDLNVLEIICDYCPNLKTLEIETFGLNADDLAQFGLKYGHMFEAIRFNTWYFYSKYWNNLLIHCKHLKRLTSCINTLFCEKQHYLPELEIVYVYQLHQVYKANDNNLEDFQLFCDRHQTTINKFKILAYNEMDDLQVISYFNSICKLKNLNDLDFGCQNMLGYMGPFEANLINLSDNCPQLQNLRLWFYDTGLKSQQFFYGFEGFKNLIKLEIFIKSKEKLVFNGTVECLKSSKNLRDLSIDIRFIGEQFFEGIDKCLPNLWSLYISCDSQFTDKTIIQFSRLKRLKKFRYNKFETFHDRITDDSICSLLKGCPELDVITFGSMPNITNRTIEALIDCANCRPKRSLHFECRSSLLPNLYDINPIDLNSFADRIPENLTITIND